MFDVPKEINFGTSDVPHPTYVTPWVMPKAENEHVILLLEFKDVFI